MQPEATAEAVSTVAAAVQALAVAADGEQLLTDNLTMFLNHLGIDGNYDAAFESEGIRSAVVAVQYCAAGQSTSLTSRCLSVAFLVGPSITSVLSRSLLISLLRS